MKRLVGLVLIGVFLFGCIISPPITTPTPTESITPPPTQTATPALTPTPAPVPYCGDGVIDTGEQCERGRECPPGMSCTINCTCQTLQVYTPTPAPTPTQAPTLSACGRIDTPNNYTLSSDLNSSGNCIIFGPGANDSTLNCNGHTINGPNIYDPTGPSYYLTFMTGTGILLDGVTGVTIENCSITNFLYGISLTRTRNSTIRNDLVSSNKYGIFTSSSILNIITGSTATGNWAGVYMWDASVNAVLDTTALSNIYDIYCGGESPGNSFDRVTCVTNYACGPSLCSCPPTGC